jgi:hypothetical protein
MRIPEYRSQRSKIRLLRLLAPVLAVLFLIASPASAGGAAALRFDGKDDYLVLGGGAEGDFGADTDFTLAVRLRCGPGGGKVLNKIGGRESGFWDFFISEQRKPALTLKDAAGNRAVVVATGKIESDRSTHIAVTVERRGSAQIYIDGEPSGPAVAVGKIGNLDNRAPLLLGKYSRYYFKGDIEHVAVYRRALTAVEVERLAAGTEPAGPAAVWRFDGDLKAEGIGGSAVLDAAAPETHPVLVPAAEPSAGQAPAVPAAVSASPSPVRYEYASRRTVRSGPPPANRFENGDFEQEQAHVPAGARIEADASGNRHLFLPPDRTAVLRELDFASGQKPDTLEISCWLQVDPPLSGANVLPLKIEVTRDNGEVHELQSCFAVEPAEASSWVFRMDHVVPAQKVSKLRVVLRSAGSGVRIDDLYIGPVRRGIDPAEELDRRRAIPIQVCPSPGAPSGAFRLLKIAPDADVYDFSSEKSSPVRLRIDYEVIRSAPYVLTSAGGHALWTVVNCDDMTLAALGTDEAISLEKTGVFRTEGGVVSRKGVKANFYELAGGTQEILTGHSTLKCFQIGTPGGAADAGLLRIGSLSGFYPPEAGRVSFLLANLEDFAIELRRCGAEAAPGGRIWAEATLTDADRRTFYLQNAASAEAVIGDVTVKLEPAFDDRLLPTGCFTGILPHAADEIEFRFRFLVKRRGEISEVAVVKRWSRSREPEELPTALHPTPAPVFSGMINADYIGSHVDECGFGPEEVDRFLRAAAQAGINTVTVVTRNGDEVCFNSDTAPRRYKDFDLLQCVIDTAVKYRIRVGAELTLLAAGPQPRIDWLDRNAAGEPSGKYSMFKAGPRERDLAIIRELVERYRIDFLYLDYVRLSRSGYSEEARTAFHDRFGVDFPARPETDIRFQVFKTDAVTRYLREIRTTVKALKPDLPLAVYVWATYNHHNARVEQDWTQWLRSGLVDALFFGCYLGDEMQLRASCRAIRRLQEKVSGANVRIMPMITSSWGPARPPVSHDWNAGQLVRRMKIIVDAGFSDVGIFRSVLLWPYLDGVGEALAAGPGEAPSSRWKETLRQPGAEK